jgi:hypothetical protein
MNTFKLYLNGIFGSNETKQYARLFYEISCALENSLLTDMLFEHSFLAGGAIRDSYFNKTPKDYDIFFKSATMADSFITLMDALIKSGQMRKVEFKFESQNTYSVVINGKQVQFCKKKYSGDPVEVISNFDYTNSMAYYDVSKNVVYKSPLFIQACEERTLDFNEKAYSPEIALDRFVRFTEEGWSPADDFKFDSLIRSSVKSKGKGRRGYDWKSSIDG